MSFSRQAMEEDRAAATGPKVGPPLRQACGRELSPEAWLDGAFSQLQLDWFVMVYEDHRIELHQGVHSHACRWCEALGNVRKDLPLRYEPLFRYVRWRMHIEGRSE